jgi:hypothetical protein
MRRAVRLAVLGEGRAPAHVALRRAPAVRSPARSLLATWRSAGAGLVLLAAGGCSFSSEAHPVFEKDGMRAEGPTAVGILFESIRGDETFLGMSNDMFRRRPRPLPRFCVQLAPQAPPVTTDALTLEFGSRWLVPKVLAPEEGAWLHREHTIFAGRGIWVVFRSGTNELVGLSVGTPREGAPQARVGPPSCARLHAFPLTRAELVDVLGTPDYEGWQRSEGNLLLTF